MKTKWFAACALIMVVCCLSGCSIGTQKRVDEINANSTWEVDLLTPLEETDFSVGDYGVKPGFGVTGYYDKKYGEGDINTGEMPSTYVLYSVTSYPDFMSKKKYVTQIDVCDPEIEVYGYSIGDSSEAFGAFLTEKGFQAEEDYNIRSDRFKKGKIVIRFGIEPETQTITRSITVEVDVTNCCGVVF